MKHRVVTSIILVFLLTTFASGQTKKWTPPRMADGHPDLQGFWTNNTYTPLERPRNVSKEFYTREEALELEKRAAERAEAAKHVGRWDAAQSNDLDDRCIIFQGAGPPMLPQGYNSNYQIVQTPGYVMILFEMAHDTRIIPLDARPHVSRNIRQWTGDSRGHWEGDTLVIETTNFNGKNPLRGSSENLRVVERFTRMDADTIQYKFTVEDESTWTRPWTAELPLRKTIGPLFESACHEGNYGLYNTLVGARLEEKKAAEEAAKRGAQGR